MIVEFKSVGFKYTNLLSKQQTLQLRNLSFSFRTGDRLGITGKSGAGKTTLLQLLTGLEPPGSGRVCVDGQDIQGKNFSQTALRKRIGLVFQFPEAQLFETTVSDDVAFGPRNIPVPEQEVRQRVHESLRRIGLPPEQYASRSTHHLSQGEKRRVAIAGVLAMRPEILALDEPTAGLDPQGVLALERRLRELHAASGTGLVIVSHDMEFLTRLVERILVLEKGELIADFKLDAFAAIQQSLPEKVHPPRAFRLAAHLREKGIPVPENVLSSVDLLQALHSLPINDKKK